jgi:hypothetical protein
MVARGTTPCISARAQVGDVWAGLLQAMTSLPTNLALVPQSGIGSVLSLWDEVLRLMAKLSKWIVSRSPVLQVLLEGQCIPRPPSTAAVFAAGHYSELPVLRLPTTPPEIGLAKSSPVLSSTSVAITIRRLESLLCFASVPPVRTFSNLFLSFVHVCFYFSHPGSLSCQPPGIPHCTSLLLPSFCIVMQLMCLQQVAIELCLRKCVCS